MNHGRPMFYLQSHLLLTTLLCRYNGPHFTNKKSESQGDYIIDQRQLKCDRQKLKFKSV